MDLSLHKTAIKIHRHHFKSAKYWRKEATKMNTRQNKFYYLPRPHLKTHLSLPAAAEHPDSL